MAITMECRKEFADQHPDQIAVVTKSYLWDAAEIIHSFGCPHSKEQNGHEKRADCLETCHARGPMYLRTFAVGKVVDVREMNGYDDSDFYATYWDDENQKFETVQYGTTRFWTYCNGASVDAPEELVNRYAAERLAIAEMHERVRREVAEEKRRSTAEKGDTVVIARGKKVPKGTTGTVIWAGMGNFGPRVGVKDAGGVVHWTAASNVDVTAKAG